MYNRKRLDRERLEIYLVHLLLRVRWWIMLGGILLLVYAAAIVSASPLSGTILAAVAAVPLIIASSYRAVVFTARLGAWVGTLGTRE
jgi:hypothetical protein